MINYDTVLYYIVIQNMLHIVSIFLNILNDNVI